MKAPSSIRWAALLVVVSVLAMPGAARAYRTALELPELSGATSVGWRGRVIPLSVAGIASSGLSATSAMQAIYDATATWEAVPCSTIAFTVDLSSEPVFGDGRSTIAWVGEWAARGYAADAAAVTEVDYVEVSPGEWEIQEADIFLNAAGFRWLGQEDTGAAGVRSARSVIAHELGHFLGLLHSCELAFTTSAPSCDDHSDLAAATMAPLYFGAEQWSLESDDIAGLCALYPRLECTPACAVGDVCVNGSCLPCSPSDCTCTRCDAPVAGSVGDACTGDDQCASGACIGEICAVPCTTLGDCPGLATTCRDGGCEYYGGAFGVPCASGEECASSRCLVAGQRSYCTRTCTSARPCPPGFTCDDVDGMPVCLASAATCSVEQGGDAHAPLAPWFVVLVLVWRRMKR